MGIIIVSKDLQVGLSFKATCSSSVIPFVDFLLTEIFFAATSADY